MRINSSFCQPNNAFLNVNCINRSLNKDKTGVNSTVNGRRQDRVSISPQGKMMKNIENLMKQKENIFKQKSDLVTKTIEGGGNLKSIENQLDFYEEQLLDIDKQISQITSEMAKKMTEKEDEKKTKKPDENKTEDQVNLEKLSKIASASESIKHAETVSSVKSEVAGEVRVEESEIKMGEIQIDALESKGIDGSANVADMITNAEIALDVKKDTVSDLQDKAIDLNLSQGENLSDTIDKLEESSETASDTEAENKNQEEATA